MEITQEALQTRLATLRQQEQQAFAAWQAMGGAVQECEYWLGQFDTQELPALVLAPSGSGHSLDVLRMEGHPTKLVVQAAHGSGESQAAVDDAS